MTSPNVVPPPSISMTAETIASSADAMMTSRRSMASDNAPSGHCAIAPPSTTALMK